MDSCQDPVSFIIDSFLERPEEWDFGTFSHDFSADYPTHKKSGFKLSLWPGRRGKGGLPTIYKPDWACKYKFTPEEKKLLMAAIRPVRERAIAKARKQLANRIVRHLDPPPPEKLEQISAPSKKHWPVIFAGSLGILALLYLLIYPFITSETF